jgi:hypothetical protein
VSCSREVSRDDVRDGMVVACGEGRASLARKGELSWGHYLGIVGTCYSRSYLLLQVLSSCGLSQYNVEAYDGICHAYRWRISGNKT